MKTESRILSLRSVESVPVYRLSCEHVDASGNVKERNCGYSFDCDASGNVDESKLHPVGLANLQAIRANPAAEGVTPLHLERWQDKRIVTPATLRCDCGARVVLHNLFASACDKCGREYNGSGALLAPRAQWGEETGEQGTF